MWPLIDAIIFLVLFLVSFLPYNVDRPARRLPYVTYSLMGINIFLFFVTVFISNVNLPADRIIGRQEAAQLLNTEGTTDSDAKIAIEAAKQLDPDVAKSNTISFDEKPGEENSNSGKGGLGVFSAKNAKTLAHIMLLRAARKLAYNHADNIEGYNRAWRIENMDSSYLLTPHYSALEWFAYRPAEPSIFRKLLGLFGSMFLHGGFEHIIGNMFFLWIFGRAVEDSLGPRVYLGAYLLCGIAATLLYHITTMQFSPMSMGIPSFGASGAIAGIMGLFAPRFYRTPVRVFYLTILAKAVGAFALGLLTIVTLMVTRDLMASATVALAAVLAGLYYFGKGWAWGGTKLPAAWFLGVYVGIFDIKPAIQSLTNGGETGDGVAHWAHIGGFLFGMMYAFLIGAQKEGKQEFMLEDATKAYDLGDMAGAVTYSQNVLEREPGNPGAYETLAKAYLKQNSEDDALDNFELAIENYLRVGERGKAAACYLMAVEKYSRFILQAPTQLAIGNQMAKNYSYKEAAETLVKIPYTFLEATEGEVALLRASQIYLQHLNQPQTTVQLLQFFLQKYPESQWMPQVERAWKMAHHQLMAPAEAEAALEPEIAAPAEVVPARIRPQAVAPVLELESGEGATQGYSTQSAPPPANRPAGTPTQQMPPQAAPRSPGR